MKLSQILFLFQMQIDSTQADRPQMMTYRCRSQLSRAGSFFFLPDHRPQVIYCLIVLHVFAASRLQDYCDKYRSIIAQRPLFVHIRRATVSTQRI